MRRLRKPTPAMFAVAVCAALIAVRMVAPQPAMSRQASQPPREVVVAVVFDGDTFATTTGERVRLLGIDAPEVAHREVPAEPYGRESADWLRHQILHKTLTLVSGEEPTDRYGRTLAWVYCANEVLVNREALLTGHAKLMDRFGLPLSLESSLRKAEADARVRKVGLWKR